MQRCDHPEARAASECAWISAHHKARDSRCSHSVQCDLHAGPHRRVPQRLLCAPTPAHRSSVPPEADPRPDVIARPRREARRRRMHWRPRSGHARAHEHCVHEAPACYPSPSNRKDDRHRSIARVVHVTVAAPAHNSRQEHRPRQAGSGSSCAKAHRACVHDRTRRTRHDEPAPIAASPTQDS